MKYKEPFAYYLNYQKGTRKEKDERGGWSLALLVRENEVSENTGGWTI